MCLVKLSSVGMGACLCVCHHQPNLLSVYVMEAILEVLTKVAPRDVCMFVHGRSRVCMGVCMSVHLPFPVSTRQLLVCVFVCICMLS